MNHTKFVVSRFENRNGVTSWRVSGVLHGIRLRKNFKTREEAAAEKAALEIKALQSTSGLRSIATALTEERVREAEALFQRVEGKSHPLSFYVDFALANYREPEKQKTLAEGITEYVAAREHEFAQDQLSAPQMKRIRNDLKRLGYRFAVNRNGRAFVNAPRRLAHQRARQPAQDARDTFGKQVE